MRSEWKAIGRTAALTVLFSESLLLVLLRLFGLDRWMPLSALVCAALTVGWTLTGLLPFRRTARIVCLAIAAAVGIWQWAGLWNACAGLFGAVIGTRAALEMWSLEAALLLTAIVTAAGLAARIGAGAANHTWLPMGLCFGALVWVDQIGITLWLFIPAVAVMLFSTAEEISGRRSLRRVLPFMAVISLLAFGIAPLLGQWMPLKPQADRLRQYIQDILFYTEPRNVFTLETEGWMPLGGDRMGGAAMPADHAVMTVRTPRKIYLRGTIKNEYNGLAWYDTIGGRRYLWYLNRWNGERSRLFDMDLPENAPADSELLAERTVTVLMESSSASSLFVPQRVRRLNVQGDMIPYFNQSSEVFITRDQEAGDLYTVSAPLLAGGDVGTEQLVRAAGAQADANYEAILRTYTLLPDHLQDALYDLAREITAGRTEPYAKARALQVWLQTNCAYSLTPETAGDNVDFVSWFLLRTRTGYCTHFASAMTVLCRMVGLPARYVEGYLAEPDAEGVAHVTGLNAHAWTEVYFAGFGWLTFDATAPDPNRQNDDSAGNPPPPQADSASVPPEAEPSPSPAPTEMPGEDENGEQDDQENPENESKETPSLWWLLILLLLALLALAARVMWTRPNREARRAKTERQRWEIWLQALGETLGGLNERRLPEESMETWLRRVRRQLGIQAPLDSLGAATSQVFYGKREPAATQTEEAQRCFEALWQALPGRVRRRLRLKRAFVPLKKRRVIA
ncbi:MAG: transglutaminase domain-containing protein [Clostridia bacterium]|nr:transglutaminase domain-containing protein [Clostridia bacterium]